jgi:hypothetical protein
MMARTGPRHHGAISQMKIAGSDARQSGYAHARNIVEWKTTLASGVCIKLTSVDEITSGFRLDILLLDRGTVAVPAREVQHSCAHGRGAWGQLAF